MVEENGTGAIKLGVYVIIKLAKMKYAKPRKLTKEDKKMAAWIIPPLAAAGIGAGYFLLKHASAKGALIGAGIGAGLGLISEPNYKNKLTKQQRIRNTVIRTSVMSGLGGVYGHLGTELAKGIKSEMSHRPILQDAIDREGYSIIDPNILKNVHQLEPIEFGYTKRRLKTSNPIIVKSFKGKTK